MGFDDLEAAEKERQSGDEESEPAPESEPAAKTERATTSEAETTASSDGSDAERERTESETAGESDQPGFEFADAKQSPMYARPEAWAALEDALDLEVVRELREAGIRNEAKRELHDAALRVAANHPEEIAEAVRESRREG